MNISIKLIFALAIASYGNLWGFAPRHMAIFTDLNRENIFSNTAQPFNEDTIMISTVEKFLSMQNTPLLVSRHIFEGILLKISILKDLMQPAFDCKSFVQKYGHFKQFNDPQIAQTYFDELKLRIRVLQTVERKLKTISSERIKTTVEHLNAIHQTDEYATLSKNAHKNSFNCYVKAYATSFDSAEWYIREVTPALYLLVPKKYLRQISQPETLYTASEKFTELEMLLGLQIDHLPSISQETLWQRVLNLHEDFSDSLGKDLIETLEKQRVFVPLSEYKTQTPPEWKLFINGHGCSADDDGLSTINEILEDGITAGLSYKELQMLLTLISKDNTIHTLLIFSCDLGGKNIELITQGLTIPYNLATSGISTNATLAYNKKNLLPPQLKSSYIHALDKVQFKSHEPQDIAFVNWLASSSNDFHQPFTYFCRVRKNVLEYPDNILLIKKKNSTTFQVFEHDEWIQKLTSDICLKKCKEKIVIGSSQNNKIFVIEAPVIKKTIEFTKDATIPFIIPYLPHYFPYCYIKKISAPTTSLAMIVSTFLTLHHPNYHLTYEIKNVQTESIRENSTISTIKNLIIIDCATPRLIRLHKRTQDERINAILFQTNACAYVTWWQFNPVPTSKSIESILAKKTKISLNEYETYAKKFLKKVQNQREEAFKISKTRKKTSGEPQAKRQKRTDLT